MWRFRNADQARQARSTRSAHGPEIFEDVFRFVKDSGLYEVQITFLTPFPGTPLYARLKREGRLIQEGAWELCTLFDINVRPKNMRVQELQSGFLSLARRLYSAEETNERRRKFKENLKSSSSTRRGAISRPELLAA